MRLLRGCLGRLFGLALLLALLAAAWLYREQIGELWDRARGHESVAVTPELAAEADRKLAALGQPRGRDRVALNQAELQSLLEYRWGGFLPPDVAQPRIGLGDGQVTLEAGVATARFGTIPELREILSVLPDTTRLRAVGSFTPVDSGRVALEIHELGAAGIPVPDRLIPSILRRFRGGGEPGLAPNAVALPLPPGIRTLYISGDSLVFVASRAAGG